MNILLRAYTQVNLGDDLFVKILCERYPNHCFHIVSRKQQFLPFEDIQNIMLHNRYRLLDVLARKMKIPYDSLHRKNIKLASRMDAVIHIGGSIFIQSNNWLDQLQKKEDIVNLSKNYYILGSNFGPYENINFVEKYRTFFSKVNDICFRDSYSYNLFSNLDNVRLAPDIVFSLKKDNLITINEKNIVISVIDLTRKNKLKVYTELYEQAIVDISFKMLNKGYNVTLMSFCETEGDEVAIERIKEKIGTDNVNDYFYRGDITEALEVLSNSSAIVASRFHSLILAWILNKPVFPFIYSDKTLNVIEDIGFDNYYLDIVDIANIDIEQVINELVNQKPLNVEPMRLESEDQFLGIDKLLN